jgi:hypothetical protein
LVKLYDRKTPIKLLRTLVVLTLRKRPDDCLGRQAMPDGIAAGTLFALFSRWAGALTGVATVSFDLSERCHCDGAERFGFAFSFAVARPSDQSTFAACVRAAGFVRLAPKSAGNG